MSDQPHDALTSLSEALAARTAAVGRLAAALHTPNGRWRSVTLWRPAVAVASEQVLPDLEAGELVLADGRRIACRLAGRDRGTNIAALRLETPIEVPVAVAAEPQTGGLALVLAAGRGGVPAVRLSVQRSVGPAWHSLAGGRIDRRVTLDLILSRDEEGGPVFDAGGHLLGMSTAGPGGRALVIPPATIERVVAPLLATGRVDRGWLGVALHPVALSDQSGDRASKHGLMVMQVAPEGPAARAGVVAGDILLALDGAPAARVRELARRFGPESIGTKVELGILRSGSPLTVAATITARPA